MMISAVSVADLRVVRGGREVLHGLTFEVPRGSIVGLLGPSGCGKTTLIRSVVGAQIVNGGTGTVLAQPPGAPGLRTKVGYSTQNPAGCAHLTLQDNLRHSAARLRAPQRNA